MRRGLLESTGYATTITGMAFTAEITFNRLRIWLADYKRLKTVNSSSLESVRIQPNGYTKLILQLKADLVIPTSHGEAVQLARALNSLISEKRAVETRRNQSAADRRLKKWVYGTYP
jgi:hypothetical protein